MLRRRETRRRAKKDEDNYNERMVTERDGERESVYLYYAGLPVIRDLDIIAHRVYEPSREGREHHASDVAPNPVGGDALAKDVSKGRRGRSAAVEGTRRNGR